MANTQRHTVTISLLLIAKLCSCAHVQLCRNAGNDPLSQGKAESCLYNHVLLQSAFLDLSSLGHARLDRLTNSSSNDAWWWSRVFFLIICIDLSQLLVCQKSYRTYASIDIINLWYEGSVVRDDYLVGLFGLCQERSIIHCTRCSNSSI